MVSFLRKRMIIVVCKCHFIHRYHTPDENAHVPGTCSAGGGICRRVSHTTGMI